MFAYQSVRSKAQRQERPVCEQAQSDFGAVADDQPKLHPAEHRAYRELYASARHLTHRWARVGTLLEDTPIGEKLQRGAAEAKQLLEELAPRTDRTITDPDELRATLDDVRRQGWVLLDQELEDGVRSVATALRDRRGRAVAAINISTHAGRVSVRDLRATFIPALLATAGEINARLGKR